MFLLSFVRKSALFLALSFLFLGKAYVHAGVQIDSFNGGCTSFCFQTNVNVSSGNVYDHHPNWGYVLGDEMDYQFGADADNEFVARVFLDVPTLDQAVMFTRPETATGTGVSDGGYIRVVYDGVDNDLDVVNFGLGNVDLTDAGTANAFRFSVSTSTDADTLDMVVYTDADYKSEVTAIPITNSENVYTRLDVLFSQFSATGTLGGADLTNVNALEFTFHHNKTAGGTPIAVPFIPETAYGLGLDNFYTNTQLSGEIEASVLNDLNDDGDFDSTPDDGDTVLYTVTLTNLNDLQGVIANDVVYSATFPPGNATFVDGSVTTTQGNIDNQTGDISINVGDIPDGESVEITYQVKINSGMQNLVNQQYSHFGSVESADWAQYDLEPLVIDLNKFDISTTLSVDAKEDADSDGFSGPGEQVTFTATVSNDGPNTSDSVVFYFPEIANATLVTDSVTRNSGTVNLGNNPDDTEVQVTMTNFASAATNTITFDMQINDPFFFAEYDSIGGQALLTDTTSTYSVLSDDPSEPGESDPTYIQVDAFPDNDAASVDGDGDGMPEEWNAGCESICQDESGLTQDANPNDTDNDGTENIPEGEEGYEEADNDGDGVPNEPDAFPYHDEASTDTDGDGMPDTCVNDCNDSALTLDDDDDNDGVLDGEDAFTPPAYNLEDAYSASLDSDGDGLPDNYNDGSNGSINCDASCQSASSLIVDDDDDGDGQDDESDAFVLGEYDFASASSAWQDDDEDGYPDAWAATCNSTCQTNSGLELDPSPNDFDNDGVIDSLDFWDTNPYAALDNDEDGMPDDWIEGSCDQELPEEDVNSCASLSGLTLDDDDDDDSVLDVNDAFPLNDAASVDGDSDGLPDEWNASCNSTCQDESGLTLDENLNDSNNDGVPNNEDDDDGDGIPNAQDAEPTRDNNPPVVIAPSDRTVNATGPLTTVSLGSASAEDFLDGSLQATADNRGPFPVGVHVVTWSAQDEAGNVGTAKQTVTVVGEESDDNDDGGSGGGGGGGSFSYYLLFMLLALSFKRRRIF